MASAVHASSAGSAMLNIRRNATNTFLTFDSHTPLFHHAFGHRPDRYIEVQNLYGHQSDRHCSHLGGKQGLPTGRVQVAFTKELLGANEWVSDIDRHIWGGEGDCCIKQKTTAPRASFQTPTPAQRPYTAVLIIPTGVGAAIGGFAGDALPVARTIASVVDCLITHPNVLNGAMLYWPLPNTLYVEGFGLDKFAKGDWSLRPVHQNRIGIVFDSAIEPELRLRHLQVADAAQATLGLDITGVVVTANPLEVEKWIDEEKGMSSGRLGDPEALLDAVGYLVEECGADAIAVVGRFPDDAEEELVDYRQGQGVDALAGVEAVISHMVVEKFGIPCAHAPALAPLSLQEVSPRSAAEEIGYTFLPCVLAGLSRAPQFAPRNSPVKLETPPVTRQNRPVDQQQTTSARQNRFQDQRISPAAEHDSPVDSHHNRVNHTNGWVSDSTERFAHQHGCGSPGTVLGEDVDAVIVPADACGGSGTLAFSRGVLGRKPPLIIAVGENETVLEDTPETLGIDAVRVANYWEAVGVLAAHKAGVRPDALRREGTRALSIVELRKQTSEKKAEEILIQEDRQSEGIKPLTERAWLNGCR